MSVMIPQAFKNSLPDSIIHIFQGLRPARVSKTASHIIQTRLREGSLRAEQYPMLGLFDKELLPNWPFVGLSDSLGNSDSALA